MAITRLRFGKCLLNEVMKMMGKHPDGKCDFSVASNIEEEEMDDMKHYFMDCMQFMYFRENVQRVCWL